MDGHQYIIHLLFYDISNLIQIFMMFYIINHDKFFKHYCKYCITGIKNQRIIAIINSISKSISINSNFLNVLISILTIDLIRTKIMFINFFALRKRIRKIAYEK